MPLNRHQYLNMQELTWESIFLFLSICFCLKHVLEASSRIAFEKLTRFMVAESICATVTIVKEEHHYNV